MLSRLVLRDLRLQVKLGCEPEERRSPQPVDVTIEIGFQDLPGGCTTDELSQTACYDRLSRVLGDYCREKEFKLIERLGLELFQITKNTIGVKSALTLHAKKVKPPVDNLLGGATFSITEGDSWSS